jgi:acyl-CoA thioesterase FadM
VGNDSTLSGPRLDPGEAGVSARPVEGVDNGFLAGYRVRFDEAGPDGATRTSTLLRYAQDIAWRHSEEMGFDREWYQARAFGWVVRGVDLELHRAIRLGQTLRISTAVVGHRRIWARRLADVRLADGHLAARVTTDWVLLDGRGRIVRIPDDFGVAFVNPEVRSEILRVPPPDGPPAFELELAVHPRDLDSLDHVNNAVYVDWLDEAAEAAGWAVGPAARAAGAAERASGDEPRTLRLEYLASATRGDGVVVELHGDAASWVARIRRGDGLELVRASGWGGGSAAPT